MERRGAAEHWRELERLIEGMSDAAGSRGRCFGVRGPAGIGKSFLLRKAAIAADGLGFRVLWGQTDAGAGPAAVFAALMPAPSRLLPADRALSTMIEQARDISAEDPALLILEDLHLADPTSISMLILLARNVADLRFMIIISYDDEMTHASCGDVPPLLEGVRVLARDGIFEEVMVQNMERSDLVRMVEDELDGPLDSMLADIIWDRSEGNPMMALEAARLLVQTRQVELLGGHWRPLGPIRMELPDDHHALIRRRLDMLVPEDKALLVTAAVAGRKFDPRVIADLLRMDLLEVTERLDRMAHDHRLLDDDGEHYRFSSGAVRSVLMDDVPPAEQRAIHGNMARIIESEMMRDAPFDDLSEHYYMAESKDKCACFSLLAGQRALAEGRSQEAISHFQKVLDATEGGGCDEERSFSLERMADAEVALGKIAAARSRYEAVLRTSPAENIRERVKNKLQKTFL